MTETIRLGDVSIRVTRKDVKVSVTRYFLQRMKPKWGNCNQGAGHIRLNTELVKKPRDLLEYVVVHEMPHLREPTHNDRFVAILGARGRHGRN
jgi:predicted metal-dependent hydrolase